ncbi:uncharacterized protein PF3D7_1120000-like [Palaemon carinicauda]|uniref:uncharacterized protein PF3D7_1120000-like n=1 Tax=Palaemon carinicauda TaxID=392227 RepID=UPI0035B696FC
MWYHAMCQKISRATYRALREHEELMCMCNNCKHELKCSKNKMKDLEERNKMLNEKLREIEEKWSKMRAEIVEEVLRKVKNEITDEVVSTVNNRFSQNDFGDVGQNQVEVVKSKVLQELEEEEEKRRRVCNLVLYNVPESEREEAEERKTEDTNWCQDIFRNSLELEQIEMEQESMRDFKDKKGGGLMVIYKDDKDIEMEKVHSKNLDILDVKGNILKKKKKSEENSSQVYMDCGGDREGKERNVVIRAELAKKIEEVEEDEALIIMGDFNGHLGFLGYQEENENGKKILEVINNKNLILLNVDEKCKGTYTWERGDQRSAIDLVLVNKEMYEYFNEMNIDEEKVKVDISDHNLIEVEVSVKAKIENYKKRILERKYVLQNRRRKS